MTISLGLDIGSNSVGSAWIDTEAQVVDAGASIFPAGVEESDAKRGSPKGQIRRENRSQRRSIQRRASRKRRLRQRLTEAGLLPADLVQLGQLMHVNPWHLRREALVRELSPHEFGRVLLHLCQRRGAIGIETDPEDSDEGAVKAAIDHLRTEMIGRNVTTFGQFMADLYDQRSSGAGGNDDKRHSDPIRNRLDSFEFHADRSMIRCEFDKLWQKQSEFSGELVKLLRDDLKRELDNPTQNDTWRHRGFLFEQRRTYWDTGTLGRCDLEPTDQRCSLADMYAQEFRVLETANNIQIEEREKGKRPLTDEERANVISALRSQRTGSVATVRKALGIHRKADKELFSLNIERDRERQINTDWFHREIALGAIGEAAWTRLTDARRDSINRAILKFQPGNTDHEARLRSGAADWWGLSEVGADNLVIAWRKREKLEKRLSLSRRAIQNLLPYLRRGLSLTEARQHFAENPESPATPEQRARYAFNITEKLTGLLRDLVGERETEALFARRSLTKADRHYLKKHTGLLPPAPVLSNPVVRKAIHEVRRHVIAHIRKHGCRPDRVIIELARETKQSEKVRNAILAANRKREKERKQIIEQFELAGEPLNQQQKATERVLLCRQQNGICPYSHLDQGESRTITEEQAALGTDLETDHIVPRSRSQDNGFNNKVLCYRATNRGKGNQTPKEWLSPEQFERLCQRFEFWKKDKRLARKWENLTRDAPATEEFAASQLTDAAYAATQVGEYLESALYGGRTDGKRRIFFTKGYYTAMLRRDWGLVEERIDTGWHGDAAGESTKADTDDARAHDRVPARKGKKDRSDHRHHAIDAVVIALSDSQRVQQVARDAAWQAEHRERTGFTPPRPTMKPPWGTKEAFRRQVLDAVGRLVVSHRPVKRKLVGAFHEETHYGPVVKRDRRFATAKQPGLDTLYTNRIRAEALTPNHLRVHEAWDALSAKLEDAGLSRHQKKQIRKQSALLPDLPPAKSGIVRDRELRDQIRKCLKRHGLDPDRFSKNEIKAVVRVSKLCMKSGVPIKGVVLLRAINDPVVIPRKQLDPSTGKLEPHMDPDDQSKPHPRTKRVYIGGNNHHIEICEDEKTGRWSGEVVDMFTAAKRVRPPKTADGSRRESRPAVARSDKSGQRFVMSLAQGETIHMRHPETNEPGYFVVFKLDNPHTIHFTHHWDARPAAARQDEDGREIRGSKREDISVPASKLKALGISPDQPPYKVRVSPLGEVTPLPHD